MTDPLRALADPHRRKILAVIGDEPVGLRVVSNQLGGGVPALAYHLSVLAEAGLLEDVSVPSRRGSHEPRYRRPKHDRELVDALLALADRLAAPRPEPQDPMRRAALLRAMFRGRRARSSSTVETDVVS